MTARLRITLRRSIVGKNPSARGTVRALGLRHIGQSVEISDGPAARGQVRAVRYLVDVEEIAASAGGKSASAGSESTSAGSESAPVRRTAAPARRKKEAAT